MYKFPVIAALLLYLVASTVSAKVVTLDFPIMEESPIQHLYFKELIEKALTDAGHIPRLKLVKLPQRKITALLKNGRCFIILDGSVE